MTCSNNFYHAVRWRQWRYDICWISLLELCICKIKLWYLYKQHRYIVEFSFFLTIFKPEKEPVIKKNKPKHYKCFLKVKPNLYAGQYSCFLDQTCLGSLQLLLASRLVRS